ncbi:ABC transporter ATP-binding protein [Oceaniglobus trochenteri]|uniref:ABC transporter ATP-binding protein n=1 Tax=Oceaniglobus trochenteri TaxID=2763260 RepID=UPI001D001433|nr:sn-glycerol-3-phosphate ABC transporter ATP-binding protein UgpC [Oceaniglobus trochenteri]
MATLELDRLNKRYGNVEVIESLALTVEEGSFTVFVGPSGCGKSTLLRMIAGLEEITDGELRIDGTRVNDATPVERGVAMVFQNYALYPHMSVEKNIAFGLKMLGLPKDDIARRVREAAQTLQIEPLLKRRPSQLSGGQRQRVAIGRAIVREPKLFLFDEPLSNLDAELRVTMRVELAKLHRQIGATMIYVTHDQTEALTLADKIVVLRAGAIEQAGTPMELYLDPANAFVAGFIGSPQMNFIPVKATAQGGGLRLSGAEIDRLDVVPQGDGWSKDMTLDLGVRPEHLQVGSGFPVQFEITVEVVENLGGTRYVYGSTASGQQVIAETRDDTIPRPGDRLTVGFDPERARFFDREGRRLRHATAP